MIADTNIDVVNITIMPHFVVRLSIKLYRFSAIDNSLNAKHPHFAGILLNDHIINKEA